MTEPQVIYGRANAWERAAALSVKILAAAREEMCGGTGIMAGCALATAKAVKAMVDAGIIEPGEARSEITKAFELCRRLYEEEEKKNQNTRI